MDFTHVSSVLTFFVISMGFGYGVLWAAKAKPDEHIFIRLLELLAVGFATFAFIGIALDLLLIPLSLQAYLLLALFAAGIPLVINVVKKRDDPILGDVRLPKFDETTICAIALLIILGVFFTIYLKGANSYPYLEDDDPWNHAQGAMYVATHHTYSVDPAMRTEETVMHGYAQYLEPYPPTYDVLMGVLRQTNDSIMWTLKFFNVLFITLGLAFFYLFFRAYMPGAHNDLKALFATFILAALPGFMSHFIWNQTLAIILIPVALFAIVRALDDSSWRVPAVIAIASAFVTQPVVSFILGLVIFLMFLFALGNDALGGPAKTKAVAKKDKKLAKEDKAAKANSAPEKSGLLASARARFPRSYALAVVAIGGGLLSMLFWGSQVFKWGISGIMGTQGTALAAGANEYTLQHYTLSDVMFPAFASRIDQATGWGIAICVLLVFALIAIFASASKSLDLRKDWRPLHALAWFALTAYLVFAPSIGLPSFWTSRAWPLVAIPLAIVVTMGVFIIINSLTGKTALRVAGIVFVALCIAATSIPAKIAVQTAQWPPGAQWTAGTEVAGYVQMQQTIPKGTRVYSLCGGDGRTLGFDMRSDPWDPDTVAMRKLGMNITGPALVSFLTTKEYQYIVIDATCVREYGENRTTAFVDELSSTGRFQQGFSSQGFLLVKFV